MPQIQISTDTLELLKRCAEPLEDVDKVIIKLAKAYESQKNNGRRTNIVSKYEATSNDIDAKIYNATSPPNLTFTKLVSAKLDGTMLVKPNWAGLLHWAIRKAKQHAKNDNDLRRLITVNFVPGQKEGDGFKYLEDVDLSIQGQDTNAAWRGIHHIAQQLKLGVDVAFIWRHKPNAAHPGETGRLIIG